MYKAQGPGAVGLGIWCAGLGDFVGQQIGGLDVKQVHAPVFPRVSAKNTPSAIVWGQTGANN